LPLFAVTAVGCSGRFFVGCHSAAMSGNKVESELTGAVTRPVQTWHPDPFTTSRTVARHS
jgi:hypothetical protein